MNTLAQWQIGNCAYHFGESYCLRDQNIEVLIEEIHTFLYQAKS